MVKIHINYSQLFTLDCHFILCNFHILGNLITSQGPATTFAFALTIAEKLVGKDTAKQVADGLLYKDYK